MLKIGKTNQFEVILPVAPKFDSKFQKLLKNWIFANIQFFNNFKIKPFYGKKCAQNKQTKLFLPISAIKTQSLLQSLRAGQNCQIGQFAKVKFLNKSQF